MEQNTGASIMLLSSREERRSALRAIFDDAGWTVYEGEYISEMRARVVHDWKGVVICDESLRDGSWEKLLSFARSGCEFIIASHLADDRMWSEMLSAGAFDLIAVPLERVEVLRVASAAWRQVVCRMRPRHTERSRSRSRVACGE